jgi:iron(III) transport system ATP-binding protein
MAELRIQHLSKHFGSTTVLRSIDLLVPSGTLAAILGPSGSGKTTLLRLLCGFEHADAGSIEVGGSVFNAPGVFVLPEHRHIGYVPQEGALFPHLSVADNITFGLPRRQRKARHRVAELLELVGLPADYAARPPQALSGGQQQRVALARALAASPALVLLDEPFSSLDAALRAETRQAVAHALAETGATALLVTHDQSEALSLGQQVAILWEGEMIQAGTPDQLYRQPATPELARFIGEAVLLPACVEHGIRASCTLGSLPLQTWTQDGPALLLLRPEQIRLQARDAVSTDRSRRARVIKVEYYGHDASVQLQLIEGGAAPTRLTARITGYSCPQPGDEVGVTVEGEVFAYPKTGRSAMPARPRPEPVGPAQHSDPVIDRI